MKSKLTNRAINLDLLKILAMFLVVVSHYIFHGLKSNELHYSWDVSTVGGIMEYTIVELMYIISCVAVNCFVMITGYFCIERVDFRWKGIIKTITTTLFYSIIFLLLAKVTNKQITTPVIINSIFPIHQELYWFVTSYVGLMLIAPFLSRLAIGINKRVYMVLLCVLFIISFRLLYGKVFAGFSSIIFFSFLYLLAGYVKLYSIPQKWIDNKGYILLMVWGIIYLIVTCANVFLCEGTSFLLRSFSYDSLILFLSVATFIYFAYLRLESNFWKSLSKVTPYVFGVYLLHDNPIFRVDLWNKCIPTYYNIPIYFHCLIVSFVIFTIGIVIDYLRNKLFILIRIHKLEDRIATRLLKLTN